MEIGIWEEALEIDLAKADAEVYPERGNYGRAEPKGCSGFWGVFKKKSTGRWQGKV